MRRGRLVRFVSICVATLIVTACMTEFTWPSTRPGSVARLSIKYGVPEDKIREVASAYQVAPEEINKFGVGDFPLNYIAERIGESGESEGYITREDVEDLMKGYEARCELYDGKRVLYLFYSTNLTHQIIMSARGESMVIGFTYKEKSGSKDIVVDRWGTNNIADSGFAYTRRLIQENCAIN